MCSTTRSAFLLVAFLFLLLFQSIDAAVIRDLEILDGILKTYDRRATPTNHFNSTSPTTAQLSIVVRSFSSPNPMSMDYKADFYLRQIWKDERFKHPQLQQPLVLSDPNLVKAIWKPEIYFPNAIEASFHFITVPNVLIRIQPDGTIIYVLRLRATFSCMMDLSKFPLDKQKCTMEVASFSKTSEELILEWVTSKPVTTAPLRLTLFELDQIETKNCPDSLEQIGNYSCLVAEFQLSRSIGYHLVQSYLPTTLMVVISWVSFWMDVNSVPGRVTLGITTLLTVSSLSTNIQENLPQTSYIKAIDVWLGTCTAFVFLALLEFTFTNYLFRRSIGKPCCKPEEECFYVSQRGDYNGHYHNQVGDLSPRHYSSPIPVPVYRNVNGCSLGQRHRRQDSASGPSLKGENGKLPKDPLNVATLVNEHSAITKDTPVPSIEEVASGKENQGQCGRSDSRCNHECHHAEDGQLRARRIDERCRFAFPFAFAIFNCIYWPYYFLT